MKTRRQGSLPFSPPSATSARGKSCNVNTPITRPPGLSALHNSPACWPSSIPRPSMAFVLTQVEVEVNAAYGDTIIVVVELPDAAVKESRDRDGSRDDGGTGFGTTRRVRCPSKSALGTGGTALAG